MSNYQSAPKPENESERLTALQDLAVLDTGREQVFEDLTRLAALSCGTPICAISLIDSDRQWFKAELGIGASETPRSQAFCARAILQTQPMVIEDATKDARFAENPLVMDGPQIRFYAGAPLITSSGHAIGTVCVIDQVTRQLQPEQVVCLQVISRHVMRMLELRKLTMAYEEIQARPSPSAFAEKAALKQITEICSALETGVGSLRSIAPPSREASSILERLAATWFRYARDTPPQRLLKVPIFIMSPLVHSPSSELRLFYLHL